MSRYKVEEYLGDSWWIDWMIVVSHNDVEHPNEVIYVTGTKELAEKIAKALADYLPPWAERRLW